MTVVITVEQVMLVYAELDAGLLGDRGKLEGAVNAPFATFDALDLYPSLVDKASKLVEAIVTAHAFDDGNKRLAWQSSVTFLELNGLVLIDVPDEEVDRVVRDLEAKRIPREVLTLWISDRLAD